MGDLFLKWWPVLLVVLGGVWWAAVQDTKMNDMQAFITATSQHTNNLAYNLGQ